MMMESRSIFSLLSLLATSGVVASSGSEVDSSVLLVEE
jgi:hypothetical protein